MTVVILALDKDDSADLEGNVVFVGRGPAEGFRLLMPRSEWAYLEEPQRIEFVASNVKLSVGEITNVREYR